MERDFANDYDEWLRLTGGDPGYGNTIPTESVGEPVPGPTGGGAPYVAPPPTTQPRPGFYWAWDSTNQQWVETPTGSAPPNTQLPTSEPTPKPNPNVDFPTTVGNEIGWGDLNFDDPTANWNWPTFNYPNFGGFETYTPSVFKGPTMEEAEQNPGYAFAKKEMLGSLNNRYFGMGLGRTPNAYNAILKNANALAQQNYDNVFDRNLREFNTNEGNRFSAFNQNNQNLFNTWNANKDLSRQSFDYQFDASKQDHNAALQKWLAKLNAATTLARPIE